MSSILKGDIRTTESMVTKVGARTTFKSVRKTVLCGPSAFLAMVKKNFAGPNIHTDFWKGSRSDKLGGCFKNTGITGMVEAKEYDCINMIAFFMAGMVDRCCEMNDGHVKKAFVNIVKLHRKVVRYGRGTRWNV